MRIVKNAAKCRKCGDIIESKHRHDFVMCSCKEIFVDGGTDYLRQGANHYENFINLSEVEHDEPVTGAPAVHFKGSGFTGAGKKGRK